MGVGKHGRRHCVRPSVNTATVTDDDLFGAGTMCAVAHGVCAPGLPRGLYTPRPPPARGSIDLIMGDNISVLAWLVFGCLPAHASTCVFVLCVYTVQHGSATEPRIQRAL